MEIPEIGTDTVGIRDIKIIEIPTWNFNEPSQRGYVVAPVVVDIGTPIVNIPGCVEAHSTNNKKNRSVTSDDPKGTITYCDAGMPNFNPIQYEPDQMIMTYPAPVPKTNTPEQPEVEAPEVKPPVTPTKTVVQCPTNEQLRDEPVGFIFDSGRKRITGYKLEGNQCVRLVEDVKIVEQVVNAIPPVGTVTTTASIAVVATTSALLAKPFADLLLKVLKPAVKKVMKKIATLRGKKEKPLSVRERRADQRDRNQAIAALRKVLKPKGKG